MDSSSYLSRSDPREVFLNSEHLYLTLELGAMCSVRETCSIVVNIEEPSTSLEEKCMGMVILKR